jgi:serine/threonine-protein kinase RsbW
MNMQHGLSVPATFPAVRDLAEAVRVAAAHLVLPDSWLFELELAIVETANNIVAHAQDTDGGQIDLYLAEPVGAGGKLVLEFRAGGHAIARHRLDDVRMAPPEAESGRGLALISACVDELHYERNGDINIWRLVKFL